MRKSLKKLKEHEGSEIVEEKKSQYGQDKTRRRIKTREPNVLGGGLVILSLVLIFFVVRAFASESAVKGTSTKSDVSYEQRQEEKEKAMKNVKQELQETTEEVKDNFGNINIMDSALESADKVSRDIDAAQELPGKTAETVKNLKIGDAISIVVTSVSRLSKVYTDALSIRDTALKQIEKL